MDENTKVLSKNGYDEEPEQEEQRDEELSAEECKAFRGLAARLDFMAQAYRRRETARRLRKRLGS